MRFLLFILLISFSTVSANDDSLSVAADESFFPVFGELLGELPAEGLEWGIPPIGDEPEAEDDGEDAPHLQAFQEALAEVAAGDVSADTLDEFLNTSGFTYGINESSLGFGAEEVGDGVPVGNILDELDADNSLGQSTQTLRSIASASSSELSAD